MRASRNRAESGRNQTDSSWHQKDTGPDSDAAAAGSAGAFGAMATGLAAAMAFVATALVLMVVGYSYGAMLDIRPEYPFILTLPFMLGALVAVVAFPIVGVLAGRAELGLVRIRTAIAAGAGFGAASMLIVWLVSSGPGADLLDWPEFLYLLQLILSGSTAGMILFAGLASRDVDGKSGSGRVAGDPVKRRSPGGRIVLVTALIYLFVMALPFLLMWQARRGFDEEAQRQASEYFRLPDGFSLSTHPESSSLDSLEKNVRYRAAGVHDQSGCIFSVDIVGERTGYEFAIREISATLRAPVADIPAGAPWDYSGDGRRAQEAVLDLAGSYSSMPLEIISVQQSGPSGRSIVMRGDGLEVVARPGGSAPGDAGVHLSFIASAR